MAVLNFDKFFSFSGDVRRGEKAKRKLETQGNAIMIHDGFEENMKL